MRNQFIILFAVLFIISCSSPDDSFDLNTNSNGQQTNNPINDGNNNDGNSNDGNNNDGNNNDGNANDSNGDDGNTNDGNSNEINSLFFNKWNFSNNSSKNDFKTNLVDFIILKSNSEYILNLDGKEERGQFIYSNNTFELIDKGIINNVSLSENEFTFELNLFNGKRFNKTAYSDKYYSDGDCTSFLECANGKTFSIASDYMYSILSQIYQGEFFYFQFSNEPTGEWINVWNTRRYLKFEELLDSGAWDGANFSDINYSMVTYESSINNFESDTRYNLDCEEDWSKWSNRIIAYIPYGLGTNTQYTTLNENSFRTVRFSINDNLGREIYQIRFTYNPDLSITLEQTFLSEQPLRMTFIERQIDTSEVDSNFCTLEDSNGLIYPVSDILFGETLALFGENETWLNDEDFYNMFTWWALILCELDLCINFEDLDLSEG